MNKLRSTLLLAFLGVAALSATGCGWTPAPGPARGRELYFGCISCHGPQGAGNEPVGAPNIAGLPQWYVETQLQHFKAGVRGYHVNDFTGLHMRPMTLTLRTPEDITSVAAYVAQLPVQRPPAPAKGNLDSGKAKYAVCQACHGPDGMGNEAMKAPPIKNLASWYVVAQLQKYKAGERGRHPDDVQGKLMNAMSAMLPDDDAMDDVAAYVHSL